MSELKVYVKPLKTNMIGETIVGQSYYLKSEADKAIAEKDKEIDELQDKVTYLLLRDRNMALNFNNAVDALAHTKYKRCLAMADYCQAVLGQFPSFGTISEKENWWDKWGERWLKLAEKFKEAK